MIVELNIGLEVNGRRNSVFDCEERARYALQYLKTKFSGVKSATYSNQYEIGDGTLVLEQGLYVKVRTEGTIFELYEAVYKLAVELNQECIAVYNPRTAVGKLIGPGTGSWGDFDFNYFEQFPEEFLVA